MSKRASGEGCITQRQNGRWQGSLQVEGRRATVYGRTRSEVAEKLKKLRQTADQNHCLPATQKLTVAEYLTTWMKQAEPRLKPKTYDSYALAIRLHIIPQLGKIPLSKLTPLKLSCHYANLSKTTGTATIEKTHRVLHKALGDAAKWGLIATNIAALVDAPLAKPAEVKLWQPAEVTTFTNAVLNGEDTIYGPLFAFLLASGCRLGEALGLRWQDVNLDDGTISVERQITHVGCRAYEQTTKTRAGCRNLTLPTWGITALRMQRATVATWRLKKGDSWQGEDRVFPTSTGSIPARTHVRRAFHALCKRHGLRVIRVHDLRHLSLSLLAMAGVPLKVAQQRAGHSSPVLTMKVYQHVLGEADKQASEALEQAFSSLAR